MKVHLIDDEKITSLAIARKLIQYGYTVDTFESFYSFSNHASNTYCDLYIIDIWIPGKDGFKIIQHLRNSLRLETPIIVLSWYDRVDYKVRALNIGADDYITKPFSIDELIARIKTVTRRKTTKDDPVVIRYKDLAFYIRSWEITKDNKKVKLTKKEKLIFQFFISNIENLTTKKELIAAIWNKTDIDEKTTNTLWVTLYNLRKKLEESFELETLRWQGYILKK